MITLIFMVYCVLFLKLKKKEPQGKQLLNSWELASSIWTTVNVDGRLDFWVNPGAVSWLHKQTDPTIQWEKSWKATWDCSVSTNQQMPNDYNKTFKTTLWQEPRLSIATILGMRDFLSLEMESFLLHLNTTTGHEDSHFGLKTKENRQKLNKRPSDSTFFCVYSSVLLA